ncbi:MAG: hypothetical protein WCD79_06630 [Chthoniobacteraceae bacterium]
MKALCLIVLLLAMGIGIYWQSSTISDLRTSLADEQAKNTQLQTDLDNAKKAAVAAAAKAAQSAYNSPLSTAAPTPVPTPSGDWMWNNKTPLDAPAKKN